VTAAATNDNASLKIAATQIKTGGVVTVGTGTTTCALIWDGLFNSSTSTCP